MDWVGRASDCSSALRQCLRDQKMGAAMQTFPIRRVHAGQKWQAKKNCVFGLWPLALKEQEQNPAVDPEGASAGASQLTALPTVQKLHFPISEMHFHGCHLYLERSQKL